MHSRKSDQTREPLSSDFRLAGVNVRVEAPERILAILDATLSSVPRFGGLLSPDVMISVSPTDESWEITGVDGSRKVLTAQSALPQVGGAVVAAAIGSVATNREFTRMRATVIEMDGRALAMIGDDWESTITLATHFHSRGWSYIGSDNALLDSETQTVFCVQKSLYVNASSVSLLPLQYRRAVEASPWYVTPAGISFYAVDPMGAGAERTWTPSATLCGIVVIDGTIGDRPSLESIDVIRLRDERFARFGVDWGRTGIADLRLGGLVDTCDLIEHWFSSLGA